MRIWRLLDLFSGAGGAAYGYRRAGFHVTGVDHTPQPRYRGDVFVQADALAYLQAWGATFDVIHASPPCQGYSVTRSLPWVGARPRLIPAVRAALQQAGKPYVIENVPGATPHLDPTIVLCGLAFGLKVLRHRLFESSLGLLAPACPGHTHVRIGHNGYVGVAGYGDTGRGRIAADHRRVAAWRRAMEIDWMTREELTQAIPPAYTEWIGRQVLRHLTRREEDA